VSHRLGLVPRDQPLPGALVGIRRLFSDGRFVGQLDRVEAYPALVAHEALAAIEMGGEFAEVAGPAAPLGQRPHGHAVKQGDMAAAALQAQREPVKRQPSIVVIARPIWSRAVL